MMTLIAFQQFSGAFVLRYYALDLYRNAGFGEEMALELTIFLGIVKVIAVGSALCYMDTIGRKFLLMLSTGLVAMGYAVLFVAFLHGASTDAWGWYFGGGALIIGGYGVGLGPALRLMESECFPAGIRGRIMAVCVIVRYACEFVVNMCFLSIVNLASEREAFLIFYIFCVVGMLFIYFFVIETFQKEPHEILKEFYSLANGGIKRDSDMDMLL
ncbi:Tret1-1 [Symbiodinium microadriaticum]|nr:Tret1-1 [Symbiodinium microadriaticum]